jgi:hypothetical protein
VTGRAFLPQSGLGGGLGPNPAPPLGAPVLGPLWWQYAEAGMPFPGWTREQLVSGRAARCPRTLLVGACCAGCAAGKGCEAEEELARVGAGAPAFQESAYPWSVAEDMDRQVETLRVDLEKGLAAALQQEPGGNATWAALSTEWGAFYPAWRAWWDKYRDDWIAHLGPITGEKKVPFDELVTRFGIVLGHAKEAGVTTSAVATDTRSPVERGLEETGKSIGTGLGTALDALGQGLVWVGVALAGGLVLYLAGPPLLRAGVKAVGGKR